MHSWPTHEQLYERIRLLLVENTELKMEIRRLQKAVVRQPARDSRKLAAEVRRVNSRLDKLLVPEPK